ncbi:MAG: hypothetical protein H0V90_05070 [Blastocatellia bacterium]|nr:hypothetical protein [Blastocatellia bacterium]
MSKKFDTNPLDPEFPEKAKAKSAAAPAYQPPEKTFNTSRFPSTPTSITEEETRRLNNARFNSYAFQGGKTPALYQTANLLEMNEASSRKIAKVGMPEKFLIGLPYLPFYIGLVAGLILLLVVPKGEPKVRFHAAQGLAAHVGILIVTSILGLVGGLAELGSFIFSAVTAVMLIVFAIKAWKGKPVHIESVDDLTNWLEEKIGPLKS